MPLKHFPQANKSNNLSLHIIISAAALHPILQKMSKLSQTLKFQCKRTIYSVTERFICSVSESIQTKNDL